MKNIERYALIFLFIGLFVIRLYHIDVPPLEIEESWRQADTESMARNFALVDGNPLRPNLNYDGPLPNIPALEIQVTTYLIALLYKVFGVHYFIARMVPVLFFMGSVYFLYRFARIHLGHWGGFFSALAYGIMPINVYYSRAVMPEASALMFWVGGIYFFNVWAMKRQNLSGSPWYRNRVTGWLFLSSVFMALSIMTKPPVIFGGLVLLYLCFHYFGWKWLKLPELWIYALITLATSAVYYYYSASIADYKFTVGITQNIIFKNALTAFYSPEAIKFFGRVIPSTFGYIGSFFILFGIFAVTRRQIVIIVWFLAMLLEVMFIVSAIRATYYLIFFTVPCALLIGNLISRIFILTERKHEVSEKLLFMGKVLSAMLIMIISMESYYAVKPMYTINTVMQTQVKVVEEQTHRDDLLVVGSIDPCLLSLSDRRGWRYNIRIYGDIPQDPYEELNYYIQHGAKYFVPIQGKIFGDKAEELFTHIDKTYKKIEPIHGYPIYQLQ